MNRLLKTILIIYPFTQYIFFRLEPSISRVHIMVGIVAVLIVYLCSLTQEKRKVAIPWFWLYVLVQSMFLGEPNYCIHISLFFLLYTSVAQTEIDWRYVLYPLGYVCVAVSLLSILEKFGVRQFGYDCFSSPGPLGNPTNSAMYIVATSPFLLFHKRGWMWFIIPAIAIWMLGSASAILGIFSVVFVYLFLKRYYLRGVLIMLSLTAISIGFDKLAGFFNPENKLLIWSRAMTDWKDFAWFGRGLGNFIGRYAINGEVCHMHNHYFYILYTLGIAGFCLLLWWLIPHLQSTHIILPYLSVVSVLVMAACSIPMRVYPITILTGINLGILSKGERYDA